MSYGRQKGSRGARVEIRGSSLLWRGRAGPKLRLFLLALSALCLLTPACSASAQPGPFGLTWGMSRDEARSLPGCEVIREDEGEFFSAIVASRLPKGLNDTDSYGLLFSRRDGLVRVQWSSTLFADDARGTGARTRYAELKGLLEQSYGTARSREVPWPKAGWEPLKFFACVADPKCGPYESTWSAGPVVIRLEIRGEGQSAGRVRLSYQHERFSSALEQSDEAREQRQRDAL